MLDRRSLEIQKGEVSVSPDAPPIPVRKRGVVPVVQRMLPVFATVNCITPSKYRSTLDPVYTSPTWCHCWPDAKTLLVGIALLLKPLTEVLVVPAKVFGDPLPEMEKIREAPLV